MNASSEFGPELRRRRLAAGLTLTRLAELLNYSKGHLSKIECGRKVPPPDLARRCDACLGAGGELEVLAPSGTANGRETGVDGGPSGDESPLLRVDRDGVRWPGGLGRRQLLAAGATSVLGLGVAGIGTPRPGDSAVAAGAMPDGAPADLAPVGIFRAQFDQMRLLGQSVDPVLLLPMLTVQTHTLRELAVQAATAERTELLTLAARYAEYAGWMAQESGDDQSALWWTARAVELAEAGGDRHLASYALVRRALVTFYAGDASQTVELVAAAQDGRLPPRIRGLAAQREAQGHALAGDRTASFRSLDRARELLARAAADDGTGEPVLGTGNLADPAAMVTGWCLHDLGHPAQAAEVLDRECLRIPPHAVRSRARYGLRRSLAHAAAGEVEHACALAAELLPSVTVLRSATITTDVARLARELTRFRANRAVLDLQPALAGALHPRQP
ncbi:helix-turn-helix domain-containing protein [Streptomyces sp. BE303]|uniref:helix-turn-helix domain-containing protein n=1 Tax=Streptomyces sp. BE303 TaxID=3002528 RepID=UPI002E77BBFF|nr:helix-turn-helix transcriptional regulator [Streptomyces sp. BE303]MED7949349.1 helix-turn-helix transcriptional regulator [Streptomyces sp. BE303]